VSLPGRFFDLDPGTAAREPDRMIALYLQGGANPEFVAVVRPRIKRLPPGLAFSLSLHS